MRKLEVHAIDSQAFMSRLSSLSKLNVHPQFIRALRDEGRQSADRWLNENFAHVGARSTFDLNRFLHWREHARARALPRMALTA